MTRAIGMFVFLYATAIFKIAKSWKMIFFQLHDSFRDIDVFLTDLWVNFEKKLVSFKFHF